MYYASWKIALHHKHHGDALNITKLGRVASNDLTNPYKNRNTGMLLPPLLAFAHGAARLDPGSSRTVM